MMDRSIICDEICRHVHIKRQNPTRKLLSKREMQAVWRQLVLDRQKIEQLEARIRTLQAKR